MDLELHIDKLVLPDLPLAERRRIVGALEQELLRLFREQGVPPELRSEQNALALDASQVSIPKQSKPDGIGRRVAQAIYSELVKRQS